MKKKIVIQILTITLIVLLVAIFTPLIGGMLLGYLQFLLKPLAEKTGFNSLLIHGFLTIPLLLAFVRQQWVNNYKGWKFWLLSIGISLLIYLQLTPLTKEYMLKSSEFRTTYIIVTIVVILVIIFSWTRLQRFQAGGIKNTNE